MHRAERGCCCGNCYEPDRTVVNGKPPRPGRQIRNRSVAQRAQAGATRRTAYVIVLGIILLIIGFVATIPILWTVGIILLIIGVILEVLGATGRAVGGRRHYY